MCHIDAFGRDDYDDRLDSNDEIYDRVHHPDSLVDALMARTDVDANAEFPRNVPVPKRSFLERGRGAWAQAMFATYPRAIMLLLRVLEPHMFDMRLCRAAVDVVCEQQLPPRGESTLFALMEAAHDACVHEHIRTKLREYVLPFDESLLNVLYSPFLPNDDNAKNARIYVCTEHLRARGCYDS